MKKLFDVEKRANYYLKVSSYKNNDRLCISITNRDNNDIREKIDYVEDITVNIPEISIDKTNQTYLSSDISYEVKRRLLDNGIINKIVKTIEYNLEKYLLVEVDLEKLREYDKEGVQAFLELNNENITLEQYSQDEIKEILEKNVKMVRVDTGLEEFIIRYKDLPDVIVDLYNKFGFNLKVYDYKMLSMDPILTTFGYFLNKCDGNVRKDIIDRLVKLQNDELKIKQYKIIDVDMLDNVRSLIEQNEMER